MAFLDSIRATAHDHHIGSRLRALALELAENLVAWNNARITRKQLSRLSERELADIGLSRGDIESFRH
ncbi:MAG: DUF1127 domain-containing protein [Rhodobacter sp.]|nr:DUF1127 domain-containing protein [Rhodobacter sp.]MCY4169704.1 DUF1127 domain-containing protein [Rhodobacter sp.]MCY4240651.1 DUF1127 domain-containing protein [Rhodobacter sp.]